MRHKDCEVQTDEAEFLLQNVNRKGDLTAEGGDEKVEIQSGSWYNPRETLMRKSGRKCICMLISLIIVGGAGFMFLASYCPDAVCMSLTSLNPKAPTRQSQTKTLKTTRQSQTHNNNNNDIFNKDPFDFNIDGVGRPLPDVARTFASFADVTSQDFQFDIEDHDVIVFLHIQKTGGTIFGKHLVDHLDVARRCVCHRRVKKRCTCLRPGPHSDERWLFSRHSTGWKCGLHADWTELTSCVDDMMDKIEGQEIKRRYFYITILRNPIHRFISEFQHVRRGATWKTTRLFCNGRSATKKEMPPCYATETWENVTLEEFMTCESNLAINRQTRMLADLSLVQCYNKAMMSPEERDNTLLLSAKNNLRKMAFFGLTEQQEVNQYLFEETFNLKFKKRFLQYNQTISETTLQDIDPKILERIRDLNRLDVELYEYAHRLLRYRFEMLKAQDPHFEEHYENMGNINFSWESLN
ncbi:hypothetical protein Pmani_026029 [Petrolisthes manimaculis]|uniref:Heparan-sulfate 6-O-sulfotransferase n=1 Tax=Petrolisthes manimaculis TaxID=1843537 RepID=A0AAE1P4D6_9EUCA|nr:hypothetical protein Pmani_026029 [Petrolisthes manimaculis]